jgi:hypothetical protein
MTQQDADYSLNHTVGRPARVLCTPAKAFNLHNSAGFGSGTEGFKVILKVNFILPHLLHK